MTTEHMAAADISEKQYQESERDQLAWRSKISGEELQRKQMDPRSIPGWLNTPAWAEWVCFCSTRGWLFTSVQPHIFGDGHISVHGTKMQRASEIPGVMFFSNSKGYRSAAAPHWVCDRRRHLALREETV
ncbi:MAG: hypothetical protein ACN6RA_14955 [Stenotrophomonas maltophilia]